MVTAMHGRCQMTLATRGASMQRRLWLVTLSHTMALLLLAGALGLSPATRELAAARQDAPPAPGIDKPVVEDPDARVPETSRALAKEIATYFVALEKSGVCEGTRGELGLRLHIYPDALEYELLSSLLSALRAGKTIEECAQQLGQREKELRRLKDKAGFQLELLHPRHSERKGSNDSEQVHIFAGELARSIQLRVDGAALEWRAWRPPEQLVSTIVQLARHYTVRHRERVAVTKPLQPEGLRTVFRGASARVWGILPGAVIDKRKAQLAVILAEFGEFNGIYNDVHIIDLNEPKNSFSAEQPELRVMTQLPFFFPLKSNALVEALTRLAPPPP